MRKSGEDYMFGPSVPHSHYIAGSHTRLIAAVPGEVRKKVTEKRGLRLEVGFPKGNQAKVFGFFVLTVLTEGRENYFGSGF